MTTITKGSACKAVLTKEKCFVQENLIASPEILDYLESKEKLTKQEIQRIQSPVTDSEKVSALLYVLSMKGPDAFNCFLQSLHTNNDYVARHLQEKYHEELTARHGHGVNESTKVDISEPTGQEKHRSTVSQLLPSYCNRQLSDARRPSDASSTVTTKDTKTINRLVAKVNQHHQRIFKESTFIHPETQTIDDLEQTIEEFLNKTDECYRLIGSSPNFKFSEAIQQLQNNLMETGIQKDKIAKMNEKLNATCRNYEYDTKKLEDKIQKLKYQISKLSNQTSKPDKGTNDKVKSIDDKDVSNSAKSQACLTNDIDNGDNTSKTNEDTTEDTISKKQLKDSKDEIEKLKTKINELSDKLKSCTCSLKKSEVEDVKRQTKTQPTEKPIDQNTANGHQNNKYLANDRVDKSIDGNEHRSVIPVINQSSNSGNEVQSLYVDNSRDGKMNESQNVFSSRPYKTSLSGQHTRAVRPGLCRGSMSRPFRSDRNYQNPTGPIKFYPALNSTSKSNWHLQSRGVSSLMTSFSSPRLLYQTNRRFPGGRPF